MEEDNKLVEERREKLKALRAQGNAYPNDFRKKDVASALHASHGDKSKEDLEKARAPAAVAGRMVLKRVMGKASFATLQDGSGRIQAYITSDLPGYEDFKHWDLGDIVGVEGHVFKTMKGELTVHATNIRLLAKALRPLPEKFHGLTDHEQRYRQRYVDLIVNPQVREVFLKRSQVIDSLRSVLRAEGLALGRGELVHAPQHTRPDPGPVQVVYTRGTRATGSGRRWSDAGHHEDEQGRGRPQGWPDHQEALR